MMPSKISFPHLIKKSKVGLAVVPLSPAMGTPPSNPSSRRRDISRNLFFWCGGLAFPLEVRGPLSGCMATCSLRRQRSARLMSLGSSSVPPDLSRIPVVGTTGDLVLVRDNVVDKTGLRFLASQLNDVSRTAHEPSSHHSDSPRTLFFIKKGNRFQCKDSTKQLTNLLVQRHS